LVIADEPVASLDVSIRVSVLNLMKDLQKEFELTYLFITHDLSVVRYVCDRVLVMYLGKIVEIADIDEAFENPLHPYTQALISSVPIPDPAVKKNKLQIKGEIPVLTDLPSGCRFETRCPYATGKCASVEPEMKEVSKGHFVACHNNVV
jgi:oligopeptide/dipeptide ABC transporter ATP-binding protein